MLSADALPEVSPSRRRSTRRLSHTSTALAISFVGAAQRSASALDWLLLQQLAEDEDTPDCPHLKAAAAVFGSLGHVAGLKLDGGHGILLLYARTTSHALLQHPANAARFRACNL